MLVFRTRRDRPALLVREATAISGIPWITTENLHLLRALDDGTYSVDAFGELIANDDVDGIRFRGELAVHGDASLVEALARDGPSAFVISSVVGDAAPPRVRAPLVMPEPALPGRVHARDLVGVSVRDYVESLKPWLSKNGCKFASRLVEAWTRAAQHAPPTSVVAKGARRKRVRHWSSVEDMGRTLSEASARVTSIEKVTTILGSCTERERDLLRRRLRRVLVR